MNYATAFIIVTAQGMMVYPLIKSNRAYIAVAKSIDRRLSDRELSAKNTDPYIRYSNQLIDDIKYLQKVDLHEYYPAGLVTAKFERALKREWINQAHKIESYHQLKRTA